MAQPLTKDRMFHVTYQGGTSYSTATRMFMKAVPQTLNGEEASKFWGLDGFYFTELKKPAPAPAPAKKAAPPPAPPVEVSGDSAAEDLELAAYKASLEAPLEAAPETVADVAQPEPEAAAAKPKAKPGPKVKKAQP
jgi:hypothetical protein